MPVDVLPPWWVNPARRAVVWPVRTDRVEGVQGPSRVAVRSGAWRRSSAGFYVPSEVELSPEQRIAEARPLLQRWCTAVTGWAALRWLGAGWFGGVDPAGALFDVPIMTAGFRHRPQAGFAFSEERLWVPEDVLTVDGLVITSPVRSVLFLMRYAPDVRAATRVADMAAYNDLVSVAELREYASHLNGWTGIPQARAALERCDENAWSPTEVDFRLTWTLDAGLPRPVTNTPVFDLSGNHIGTPDLIDPEAGVIGEYDGSLHLLGAQRTVDVRREALFRGHGLECVTMLSSDLPDRRPVVSRLREAYARAAHIPTSTRTWTTDPPPWWRATSTVELRRALTPYWRERLLHHRYRAA